MSEDAATIIDNKYLTNILILGVKIVNGIIFLKTLTEFLELYISQRKVKF